MPQAAPHWIALAHLLDPVQLQKLYRFTNNGETAWQIGEGDLRMFGFAKTTIERFTDERNKAQLETYSARLNDTGITAVTITDPSYPAPLQQLFDAPIVLFYRGTLPAEKELALAVVGTRRFSSTGKNVTIQFVRALAKSNLTIVSGLARGIDGLAHEATLEMKGRAVAVLGSSVADKDIYPWKHRNLAKRIAEQNGLVISEYPPGVGPARHHFPARNRIIAGLTLGTLVIEAPKHSGALITARQALEYNREVMAVPGPIFEASSEGTNELIKLGARVITSVSDIIEALNLEEDNSLPQPSAAPVYLSPTEETVLAVLSRQPVHIDALAEQLPLSATDLLATLSLLEMKDAVRDIGGKQFVRL
ncbi:DNA-protecting protein DprA [Candidatus Uhrbacteria bacterium CG10_big_fil_rev_8_21_14_0_10_48_11]|uniref:DNA-protecting protein DprA n=1 Tax=Candidatus Uhrbacteria bacterium CG10_big_fil_rev_8_21_14_0_10_48_11 TaxID=1975037 RepID=A0A2M8LDQ7_9BACT|nr:MAG: DNA-protecting protein DprA [Candidatus Uhrbacteria bacterium CG10_big_fil_rev_8_21_14_0_10_48_11]